MKQEKLISRLQENLSAEDVAALCEAVRTLDGAFFRDVMFADMKPMELEVNWDEVTDPRESEVIDINALRALRDARREEDEERYIDHLARAIGEVVRRQVPERLRRWVLLQVIAQELL